MSLPPLHTYERINRTTVPQALSESPDKLYDLCLFTSKVALNLSYHYSGKRLSAVAPLWDDGSQSEFKNPILKIVSAGSYKPYQEVADEEYIRVCAEQNMIDNGLRVGDNLEGVLFIRSEKHLDSFEGNHSTESPHLCGPCRGRALPIFGGNLVVVSFIGTGDKNDDALEATTIRQQIEHHDFNDNLEVLAKGKDVKEYVTEEVFKNRNHTKKIDFLPYIPSRRYRKES